MDLFVCTLDTFGVFNEYAVNMIKNAINKNIPVWIELHKNSIHFDLSDVDLDKFEMIEITRK